ncbi:MAG TPA: host attachment protein [Steroidobacteraceae bacterium]|jgi:protein required for attachment to host cells|nr:host attachment protein [Steroidobacteraceae bacterium]
MTRQTNFDPRWGRHGGVYVVVADGGRARIFKRNGRHSPPQLLEVEHLERASARQHARELTTDLTGRVSTTGMRVGFGPRVTARHGAQSDYDPHVVEVERFARQLSARIARLAKSERIEELVLIAEPRFLGVLRRKLPEPLRHVVTRELARDLTAATPTPIARAAFSLESAPARQ